MRGIRVNSARVILALALYTGQVDRCHVYVGVWIERRYEYVEKLHEYLFIAY